MSTPVTSPVPTARRTGTAGPEPRCPVAHGYDAFDQAEPFGTWEHLRSDDPVFYDANTGCWVVSRYADVKAVFGDWETFSSEIAHLPVRERGPQAKQIMDDGGFTAYSGLSARIPPDHTRIRKVVGKGFTPRRYAALEPTIRQATVDILDRMTAEPAGDDGRSTDLVRALCDEIPVITILALLGIRLDLGTATFKRWSAARAAMTWGDLTDEEQVPHAHALVEYWQTCVGLVEEAHRTDPDSLVGDLVRAQRDGDPITDHEIASVCYSLLFAGHETTTVLMSNAFRVLLADRGSWERLVADPALVPNAVDEVLRVSPSLTAWRRVALRDTEIGGVPVPAGAHLLLLMGSANRDEEVFAQADTVDITRSNAREHLAFGYGIHYCLGNKLAKLESTIVLQETAARIPQLRLADDVPLEMSRSLTVRTPLTLPVTW